MRVIDIIRQSAELLGLVDLVAIIDRDDEDLKAGTLENSDLNKLFSLSKFAMQELCTNYCPILIRQEFTTLDKKYPTKSLNNYIRLVNVKKNDEVCDFKIYNREITLAEDGTYVAEYMSYCMVENVFDEIDFLDQFSPDVLVFAVCAYYSVSHGMFEQFEDFHEMYVNRANSLKELRAGLMPMRKWE